jgi:hypothetical protein
MKKVSALFAALPLIILSLAGCGKGGDDPAGQSGGWSIAAGQYSNAATDAERTFTVALPQGDRSKSADLRRCIADDCHAESELPLRRGLNGLALSYEQAGRTIDVTITPASPTTVMVSGDWGAGLETAILPKVNEES